MAEASLGADRLHLRSCMSNLALKAQGTEVAGGGRAPEEASAGDHWLTARSLCIVSVLSSVTQWECCLHGNNWPLAVWLSAGIKGSSSSP